MSQNRYTHYNQPSDRPIFNEIQSNQYNNVIPNTMSPPAFPQMQIQPTFIPRQHKVIITSNNRLYSTDTHGSFTVKLQEPIKDIVSVCMLNCYVYDVDADYTNGNASFIKPTDFLTLHIGEFGKNISTTQGNGGFGDKLHDSFAVLYYRGNGITPGDSTFHHNTYYDNKDIKLFDPPLAYLEEFKINLYDNAGVSTANNFVIVFELLIETLAKMRVYR
jgi:hypothetical protein